MKNFGYFLSTMIAATVNGGVIAYTFMKLWAWCVVITFAGVPQIGFWSAYGLTLILSYTLSVMRTQRKQEGEPWAAIHGKAWMSVIHTIVVMGFVLPFGYLAKVMIGTQ